MTTPASDTHGYPADLNGFVSFGSNRSDTAGFDYDAVTAGGGIALTFRF